MSTINFDIFAKDHNAAKTFDRVGDSAQGVSGRIDQVAKKFDRGSAVIQASMALAGTAVLAFGKASIDAASDQNEALSKSTVIFGDQAAAVEKWASTAATSMGMSKTQALAASASFGDMFLQLGFAGDAAADMSKQVVQMSADLGSFNNLPTAEVVDMISASFRGEYDSLQRVIPNINAARVQTEALATTGKKSASELTAQEKAAATLSIVMKDGARAQGDFARTADGAANKSRIAAAKFEDMQAVLGQKLLPVWTRVLDVANLSIDTFVRIIDVVGSIPAPVMAAVAGLTAFHLLSGPLGRMGGFVSGVLGALSESFGYARQAAERAGGGVKGFTVGIRTMVGAAGVGKAALAGLLGVVGGPLGVAFIAATAGLTGWIQAQQNARRAGEELAETLEKQTGAWTELTRQKFLEKFFADFDQADYAGVKKVLEDAGVGVSDMIAAYQQGGPAIDAFKAKFDAWQAAAKLDPNLADDARKIGNAYAGMGRDMDLANIIATENADATTKVAAATGTAGRAASSAAPLMTSFDTSIKGTGDEALTTTEALKKLALASLEVTNAAMGADAANASYQASLDAATAAAKENGKAVNKSRTALDLNTDAGRSNSRALQTLATDALAAAQANLENGSSAASVTKKLTGPGGARDAFIETARKMGLNREAAERLATKYGLTKDSVNNLKTSMDKIPKKVKSELEVATATATRRLLAFRQMYNSFGDKQVTLSAVFTTSGFDAAQAYRNRRAKGGRVLPGEVYAVGDNADGSWNPTTELLIPDRPGQILSAAESRKLLRGTGSGSVGSGGGMEVHHQPIVIALPSGEPLIKTILTFKRTHGGVELGIA